MFKLLGVLCIFNVMIFCSWWVLNNNPYKLWMISLCMITIFVGIFFILQDRAVEITFKNIGKIKAAAQSATSDAQEITKMKEDIQKQSNIVNLITSQILKHQEEIKKMTPTLVREAFVSEKIEDNLFYIGLFYKYPHPILNTTAHIKLKLSKPYIYESAFLKGIHKTPKEILLLEKRLNKDIEKLPFSKKVFELTWNATPSEYLMIRFWSKEQIEIVEEELTP